MRNLRISLLLICIVTTTVWAQGPPVATTRPAKPPRVTRIRFSLSSGMCYGYCYSELDVKPGEAVLLNQSREDKNRCPDLRVKADLSDKHWQELVQLIDHRALFALQDKIGCPGCVDEVVEFIEIQFNDRTKKTVLYNEGNAPEEIKALSAKLTSLQEKLNKELPPTTRCGQ